MPRVLRERERAALDRDVEFAWPGADGSEGARRRARDRPFGHILRWCAGGATPRLAAAMTPEEIRILRAMTPEQKLRAMEDLYWAARALKAAWLRSQHPNWSEEEIQREVRAIFMKAAGCVKSDSGCCSRNGSHPNYA